MVYSERTAQKVPDKKVMKKTPRTPRKSTRRNGFGHQADFKEEGAKELAMRKMSDLGNVGLGQSNTPGTTRAKSEKSNHRLAVRTVPDLVKGTTERRTLLLHSQPVTSRDSPFFHV